MLGRCVRIVGLIALLCSPVGAAAQTFLYGDLDADGVATSADVVAIVNHLNGSHPLPPEILPYADADRLGEVNAGDLDWIVRSVLGEVGLYSTDPRVGFSDSVAEVNEGDPFAAVHVALSGYAVGTLNYTVTNLDATPGVDYTPLPGSLAVNGIAADIPLGLIDDTEREGFESLMVTVTGLNGFALAQPTKQEIMIRDNETLWNVQVQMDAATLPLQMEIDRVGQSIVGGRLISSGDVTIPAGAFNLTVTSTPTLFDAMADPIAIAPEDTMFGASLSRQLHFHAEAGERGDVTPSRFIGDYEEAYSSPAPHLNFSRTGRFSAIEIMDTPPVKNLMLEPLP